jgi:hypothetical protein
LLVLALALGGCAREPAIQAAPAPPAEAPPLPPPPPPPPVPYSPEQARTLTREALEPLQAGDEATARTMLEQAQKHDPAYELPKRLLQQITGDPQRDYGAASFPYRVERGDTLATIAQRFLNDKYLFYALAKYNDIKVPRSLQVGQTLRIWGKAPRMAPAKVPPPDLAETGKAEHKRDAPPVAVEPAKAKSDLAKNDDATRLAAADARREQAVTLHREATAELSRQNLCRAIALWDRVVELDPEQKLAHVKRAQALDLREKLCRIDETRCCVLEARRR